MRGPLEVIQFEPGQATVIEVPADHPRKSDDIWSRLRLEYRRLTSCAVALASLAMHVFLVAPVLWTSASPPRHSADRKYAGDTAMQWVLLDDSPAHMAVTPASLTSPALVAIGLSDTLPTPPATVPVSDVPENKDAQSDDHSSLGVMYGRYVGQIQARIDRAWLRPRTAIGAPIFQCQVQIDQDGIGRVEDVTLLQCNGHTRWRLSLVHAIEAASPLPAPPNPAVFARHVLLEFRAMAYSPGAQADLYESSGPAAARADSDESGVQSEHAFQALREAVRAPHSSSVIELRIEGSKADVEPEHQ